MYLIILISTIFIITNLFLLYLIGKNRINQISNCLIGGLYSKDDYLVALLSSIEKSLYTFINRDGKRHNNKIYFWQSNESKDKFRRSELILGLSKLLHFKIKISEKELYNSIINWSDYVKLEKFRDEVKSKIPSS